MEIKHENLVGTFEQKKAQVAEFNLMNDDFFSVAMRDKKACEYVLNILLGQKVTVKSVNTQYTLRNLPSHSVALDLLVENDEKKLFNVEIQVRDNDDHLKRVRYYRAALDWSMLEKGTDYSELPDVYMLYISKFDIFKKSKCCYEVKRMVSGTDIVADNGVHEMYFNTIVNDGSELAKMLQYFENSDPNNDDFGALSKAVQYCKFDERGVSEVCEAVKDYGDKREAIGEARGEARGIIKGKIESIERLLEKGMPLDEALEVNNIDKRTYQEYSQKYSDDE